MITVVFDTNVFVAAMLKKCLADYLLRLAIGGAFQLVSSRAILDELEEKLTKKFTFPIPVAQESRQLLEELALIVEPKERLAVITRDPADNKILECAVESHADIIVTFDRDLLQLKQFRGTAITHPKTLTWILPKT